MEFPGIAGLDLHASSQQLNLLLEIALLSHDPILVLRGEVRPEERH